MRSHAGLLALLVAGTSALPQLVPREETCDMMYNTADPRILKETWENSGAADFLDKFLTDTGVPDWTNHFFRDVFNTPGGTPFDCVAPRTTQCGAARDCTAYDPHEAFFVHQSIATLYSQYNRVYEAMQDAAVEELGSGIQEIVDAFVAPPGDSSYLFTILVGAFVSGAALAGPHWQVGAPLTGVVGALNLASGMYAASPKSPMDYEKNLSKSLVDFYKGYRDTLDKTVGQIFGGKFDEIDTMKDDPKSWLLGTFERGKLLDQAYASEGTTALLDNVRKLIKLGFIVECMRGQEYHVSRRTDVEEADCGEYTKSVWLDGKCTYFGKTETRDVRKGDYTETVSRIAPLSEEQGKFFDDYGLDMQAVLQNALDCDGGDPEGLTNFPAHVDGPTIPKCFVNLRVKEENSDGEAPPPPPPPPVTDYKPGWCGVHVYQKHSGTGHHWEISATIYDDEQNEIAKMERELVRYDSSTNLQGDFLPNWLEIIPRDDTVYFNYATVEWDATNTKGRDEENGHECGLGKWDYRNRNMDCSFWC